MMEEGAGGEVGIASSLVHEGVIIYLGVERTCQEGQEHTVRMIPLPIVGLR